MFDLGSNYSTITGRFTVPVTGYYQVNFSGNLSTIPGGVAFAKCEIWINGGTTIYRVYEGDCLNATSNGGAGGMLIFLNATDYVTCVLDGTGGASTCTATGKSGSLITNFFSATLIS